MNGLLNKFKKQKKLAEKFFTMKKLELQTLYICDNLALLKSLPSDSIDLVLTDPPFETKSVKKSKAWDSQVQGLQYYDSMGGGLWSYAKFLKDRIEQVHRVLKPTGVLCLHLDYRSVHYASFFFINMKFIFFCVFRITKNSIVFFRKIPFACTACSIKPNNFIY